MGDKKDLIERLKQQGAFWSYSKEGLTDIPAALLIETTLRMGDVPEILKLFELYEVERIKDVWHKKLLPDQRIYPHNYYLAKVFFKIADPEAYIKPLQQRYSRYERIKNADT